MLPGVLSEDVCFEEESHYDGLLEYPQYTRPSAWRGREVPQVLLNGHHEKIKKREGRFISSKPSSGSKANPLHGLGLISVTNNVNKYGGTIDINYNDTTFIVDILIPNYR